MKKIKYVLAALLPGLLGGCSELDKVTIGDEASRKAPVMTAHEPIVITGENLKTGTASFAWTAADYGFTAAPVYTVMISVGGGTPVELSAGPGASSAVSYETLNNKVQAAGAVADQVNEVTFTVSSVLTAADTPLVSAPVVVKITPYLPPPTYLWIAGNLNVAMWAPGSPQAPKLTSPAPGQEYEGMVDLTSGGALEFKFCGQPDWNPDNWGGTSAAFVHNGPNITDQTSGYYRMVVNNGVTKIVTALKINTIGAIGNGVPGDWGSETKMTYDAAANTWTIPSIAITGGNEFKLRINDNWDNSIGGTLDAATFTGGNFKLDVPSGNYKMVFHAGVFPYKITLTAL